MNDGEFLFEACVESVEAAVSAVDQGRAGRLELCSRLDVGGLTPDQDLIEKVLRSVQVPVMTMVRPRPGGFVPDPLEVEEMERTIVNHKALGVAGVVFGVLDGSGLIHRGHLRRLIQAARPLAVTFHRAFDRCVDMEQGLNVLMELGVERVLTSGGAASALEGAEVLRRLVILAGGRITILAGGGVRPDHRAQLVAVTGVREVHGSRW